MPSLGLSNDVSSGQNSKGYEFESETDTEVIPKLIKYVYDNRENDYVSFSTLVERVIQQLVSLCVCVCVCGQGVIQGVEVWCGCLCKGEDRRGGRLVCPHHSHPSPLTTVDSPHPDFDA